MTSLRCISSEPEGVWRTTVARIASPLGTALQQSDVDSVTLRIWKRSGTTDDSTQLAELDIAVSDCIFDTLQTDGWWDVTLASGAGYNFRHTLKPGDEASGLQNTMLSGGTTYELEYEVSTFAYGPMFVLHTAAVEPILSR